MRPSLDALLSMTPEQALLRVRNAPRVSGALCRGLTDYVFSLRFVDPSLMVSWGLVAEAAAERTSDHSAAGLAQAHFGNALRVKGECAGALAALERAEKVFPGAHPLIHEFRASLLLGRLDFSGAMRELRQAYEMRTSRAERIEVAKVLLQMGMVQDFLKQHGEAVLLVEQAIGILLQCAGEGREILLIALQNLADCLVSDGQLGRARALLDEIEAPFSALGPMSTLKLTWLRGRLANHAGMDDDARRYYDAARAGYRKMDLQQEVALVSLDLALHHHQYGRYATCVRQALAVKPTLRPLGLENDAQVADLLTQIASRSGDLERALLTLSSIILGSRQKRTAGG